MIEQTYNLNLVPNSAITMIRCSQYDSDSRTLKFNLYNGAVAYNVPSLCTVTIRGTKKDSTGFEYPCSFVDNVVSFTLKDQMTLFPGDLMCELRIAHGNQVLGSANFLLVIEKSPLNANTAISESEYPIYEELVRRAEEAAAQSDGVKKVNNTLPDGNGNVELQTLPSGGTAGQTIIKQSATEGDAIWADLNATGIELTQAEYDALSEAEKNNGSLYFITDGESAPSANRFSADGISYGSGSVADKLDLLNGQMKTVTSGSMNSLTASGIYYCTSAVTDAPLSGGGVLVIGSYNSETASATYISYTTAGAVAFGKRNASGWEWVRTPNLTAVTVRGTTTSSGAIDVPVSYRNMLFVSATITSQAGFVFRRDSSYFTVMNNDLNSAIANTAVTFTAYFLEV